LDFGGNHQLGTSSSAAKIDIIFIRRQLNIDTMFVNLV